MTTDPRLEAAAKAMHVIRCGARCKQEPGEVDVIPATEALTAADAVMFSEEAIERAARALFTIENHEADWEALPLNQWVTDIYRKRTRAVVAALRGGEA